MDVDHESPRIHDNVVVWSDDRRRLNQSSGGDIFAYDILSDTEMPVADGVADETDADVSGESVVWTDWDDHQRGSAEICSRNLHAGAARCLTSNAYNDAFPRLSDGKLSWVAAPDGNFDVFVSDLAIGMTLRLTSTPYSEFPVVVSDSYVAWEGFPNQVEKVFVAEIVVTEDGLGYVVAVSVLLTGVAAIVGLWKLRRRTRNSEGRG